jgi:response regulator of citrate/malate metabolism
LPDAFRQHRLLELLIWLREQGIRLPTKVDDQPISKVRALIETDIDHQWIANEVAEHFAMSAASMRRWLFKTVHVLHGTIALCTMTILPSMHWMWTSRT